MLPENLARWLDPRTWPWFVWVWLAFIVAGWIKPAWKWFQRRSAQGWPTVQGRIESADVHEKKRFLISSTPRGRAPAYVAELVYSYTMSGQYHSGRYEREFGSEEEGREFVRDLQGKSVMVSYNPQKAAKSTLSEDAVSLLLNTRPPALAGEGFQVPVADVPNWVKPLLWPCIAFSSTGLVLSLWVHLGAVAGRRVAPEAFFWGLHVGAIAIWFPTVFVAQRRIGNINRKDMWKVVLRDTPTWMRYMVYGFFGYAMVNFALFMLQMPTQQGGGANPPAAVWRGFSGHWMAFYSASLAILYSAVRSPNEETR